MNKKVEIIIETKGEKGNRHIHPDGTLFTDVSFMASTYGAGSPCKSEQDVLDAMKHYKEWILREGDIPVVRDKREVQQTLLEVLQ